MPGITILISCLTSRQRSQSGISLDGFTWVLGIRSNICEEEKNKKASCITDDIPSSHKLYPPGKENPAKSSSSVANTKASVYSYSCV
jgi:hypothetical protein